ncbi:MAG: sulfatase-like hydrolase/transferase, partial [Opitutales bacterium]|nr:sulfatase-like hydrolase/transferase [Opitutales bacterium]
LGIRDDTLIIYMGDNGGSRPIYAENTPLRGSKFTLYEGGTRVPLIISQPGTLPESRVSDNVVSAFDLLPTMLSVAGQSIPEFADGIDLLPLLNGKEPKLQHDALHWKTADEWSVRQGDWKLHTVHGEGAAPVEKVELEQGVFLRNLITDPSESINFAKQHPEILVNLNRLHETWVATLPASMSNVPSATEWAEAPKEK